MPVFRISQHQEIGDWLVDGIKRATQRGLLSSAMRIIGIIQNELIPAENPPPIFDRAYTAAWSPEVTDRGVDIKNTLPYASVIEYGAQGSNVKIGRAMIDALTDWVYRKGLVGRPRGARAREEAQQEARGIAWAIAMNMKKVGMFNRDQHGLRIAEKAAKRATEVLADEVARELRREFASS